MEIKHGERYAFHLNIVVEMSSQYDISDNESQCCKEMSYNRIQKILEEAGFKIVLDLNK